MSEIYVPTNGRSNTPAAVILGVLCAAALFTILPLLQGFSEYFGPGHAIEGDPIANQLPPKIEVPTPKKAEEEKKIKKPILDVPPPPPTLDEVIALLNPSDGGVGIATGIGGWSVTAEEELIAYLPNQLDTKPKVLVAVKPVYPYSMKGTTGRVIVEFIIDENGRVVRPRISKSSHREFERPAIEAVHRSQWEPGKKDNTAVRSIVRLPIEFKK